MARKNNSAIPLSLHEYLSRLDRIHQSLSTMGIEAGNYNHIVGGMAASVLSTSTALRKAVDTIHSMELKQKRAAHKPPRKAEAAGAGQ